MTVPPPRGGNRPDKRGEISRGGQGTCSLVLASLCIHFCMVCQLMLCLKGVLKMPGTWTPLVWQSRDVGI